MWAGGFAFGAITGWATLMLTFPAAAATAVLTILYVRWSRGGAAVAGLLAGLGAISLWAVLTSLFPCEGSSAVTVCKTLLPNAPLRLADEPSRWPEQGLGWAAASLALLVAAGAATLVVRHVSHGTGNGTRWLSSERVTTIAVAILALVTWAGFPLRLGEYAISTDPWRPAWLQGPCAGVGLNALVRGSPTDPRIVWLQNLIEAPGPEPDRLEVIWPVGYRARFTPQVEVLDGWGDVVLRDGDPVTGSCGQRGGDPPEFVLGPPFPSSSPSPKRIDSGHPPGIIFAEVAVPSVAVVDEPHDGGEVIASLTEFALVMVVDQADQPAGWVRIEFAFTGLGGAEYVFGWVPARTPDGLAIRALDLTDCPAEVDVATLAAMLPHERLVCLESEAIELTGWATDEPPSELAYTGQPEWLAVNSSLLIMSVTPIVGGPAIPIHLDPGLDEEWPLGQQVRVTGHFSDRRSESCEREPTLDDLPVESAVESALWCRQQFVVDAIQLIAN